MFTRVVCCVLLSLYLTTITCVAQLALLSYLPVIGQGGTTPLVTGAPNVATNLCFRRYPNTAIFDALHTDRHTAIDPNECQQRCLSVPSASFVCRSIVYDNHNSVCDLFAVTGTQPPAQLIQLVGRDYYEPSGLCTQQNFPVSSDGIAAGNHFPLWSTSFNNAPRASSPTHVPFAPPGAPKASAGSPSGQQSYGTPGVFPAAQSSYPTSQPPSAYSGPSYPSSSYQVPAFPTPPTTTTTPAGSSTPTSSRESSSTASSVLRDPKLADSYPAAPLSGNAPTFPTYPPYPAYPAYPAYPGAGAAGGAQPGYPSQGSSTSPPSSSAAPQPYGAPPNPTASPLLTTVPVVKSYGSSAVPQPYGAPPNPTVSPLLTTVPVATSYGSPSSSGYGQAPPAPTSSSRNKFDSVQKGKISACADGEVVTFLKTLHNELRGNDDLIENGVSEQRCTAACIADRGPNGRYFLCKSFDYDPSTRRCALSHDAEEPTGGGQLSPSATKSYYEKICVNATVAQQCPGPFVRIPEPTAADFAQQALTVVSKDGCLAACSAARQNFGFTCTSGVFDYEALEMNCLLIFEERNAPGNFTEQRIRGNRFSRDNDYDFDEPPMAKTKLSCAIRKLAVQSEAKVRRRLGT